MHLAWTRGRTRQRDVELAFDWDGSPAGVVGWAEGGFAALELAARHGGLVERLVLVSTPPLESEAATAVDPVRAKTLLLYGMREGGSAEAKWWQKRLGGRFEMVPDGGATSSSACGHASSRTSPRARSGSSRWSRSRPASTRRTST